MSSSEYYFKTVDSTEDNEVVKFIFETRTMVLFSKKTNTPLAALVLTTKKENVSSMITKRPTPINENPNVHFFQCILGKDNEIFYFTIMNLTHLSSINFNILRKNYKVTEVDPGPEYGINEVNELWPNQAYTIPCDQKTNREMKLVGIPNVTVHEQESKGNNLSFYISVVANGTCKPLIDLFTEGTVWKATSVFVRPKIPRYFRTNRYETRYMSANNYEKCKVESTQAAKIEYGDDEIRVKSRVSCYSYDYEHPSEPTVIRMSICTELDKFLNNDKNDEDYKKILQDFETNQISNTYKSEECIICMSEPSTHIICQCGHQCLCDVCAASIRLSTKICPLCRETIKAIIKLENFQ